VYKRQIYQIAESNRIEKIDSVAIIESKLFLPELECSTKEGRWAPRLHSSRGMAHFSFLQPRGPIRKISYDLSYDYLKFIVRSSYDSDLKRAKISLRNIVSKYEH